MKLDKIFLLSKLKVGTKIYDTKDARTPFGIITEIIEMGNITYYKINWYSNKKEIGSVTMYGNRITKNDFLYGAVILLN